MGNEIEPSIFSQMKLKEVRGQTFSDLTHLTGSHYTENQIYIQICTLTLGEHCCGLGALKIKEIVLLYKWKHS